MRMYLESLYNWNAPVHALATTTLRRQKSKLRGAVLHLFHHGRASHSPSLPYLKHFGNSSRF